MQFISSKKIEEEFIESIRFISNFVELLQEVGEPETKLAKVKEKSKILREEIIGLKSSLSSIKDTKTQDIISKIIEEKEKSIKNCSEIEIELEKNCNSYSPEIREYSKYVHHIAHTYTRLLDYETYKSIVDKHLKLPYEFEAYAICLSDVKSRYGKSINLNLEGSEERYKILKEANKGFDSFVEWLKYN